eukprot:gene5129-6775_t
MTAREEETTRDATPSALLQPTPSALVQPQNEKPAGTQAGGGRFPSVAHELRELWA